MTNEKRHGARRDIPERTSPEVPPTGSDAGVHFFETWGRTNRFVGAILKPVEAITGLQRQRASLPSEAAKLVPEGDALSGFFGAGGTVLWEVVFCRHVDNFQAYLAHLLRDVLPRKPELVNEMKFTTDVGKLVAGATDGAFSIDVQALLREKIEKKVRSFAYGSFAELHKFMAKRLGLPVGTPQQLQFVDRAIQTRNISVHNRGMVNGARMQVLRPHVRVLTATLSVMVADLDRMAIDLNELFENPIEGVTAKPLWP